MKYFPFDKLQHTQENLEMLGLVVFVYILIFGVSYVYNRFSAK